MCATSRYASIHPDAFTSHGTHVAGITPTGRATVIALRLNNDYLTEARALWIESNWHPPS
ncbi:MAG: hypothetical protein AAF349_21105 [Cyanobacteria bacterium P01_A01_bin.68]